MHKQHRPTRGVRNDGDDGCAFVISWGKNTGKLIPPKFLYQKVKKSSGNVTSDERKTYYKLHIPEQKQNGEIIATESVIMQSFNTDYHKILLP
ncbi:hypothetical protein [Filimonas effusa]|uniref:Uncharacterized protein n=1 Tax=Filimonas effusa TaxID=2508721 RepID=A0A4Q1D9L6_9BACT|nr:hypothetical protein [Filimonas effusa]RXK85538.1 hypothetical protein ESB13_01610 [Filimonas effusa]